MRADLTLSKMDVGEPGTTQASVPQAHHFKPESSGSSWPPGAGDCPLCPHPSKEVPEPVWVGGAPPCRQCPGLGSVLPRCLVCPPRPISAGRPGGGARWTVSCTPGCMVGAQDEGISPEPWGAAHPAPLRDAHPPHRPSLCLPQSPHPLGPARGALAPEPQESLDTTPSHFWRRGVRRCHT